MAALALVALLPACAEPVVGSYLPGGGLPPLEPTLTSITANVFVPRCSSAACHGGGTAPDLSTREAAFLGLVNATSTQSDRLPLVAPQEPDRSYLMQKLLGTQATSGSGDVMPPAREGDPLTDEQLAAITFWISNGAQDD